MLALLLSSSVTAAEQAAASPSAKLLQYIAGTSDVLIGLNGVSVMVEDLNKDATEAGLSTEDIKTQVELRLRTLGIRVLTEQELKQSLSLPILCVNVTALKHSGSDLYAISISVQLLERLFEVRQPGAVVVGAIPWQKEFTAISGGGVLSEKAKDSVLNLVDAFANDYLAANPKK